jgi:hypothetical protein
MRVRVKVDGRPKVLAASMSQWLVSPFVREPGVELMAGAVRAA